MKEILNKYIKLSKETRILAIVGLTCLFICLFLTYIKYTIQGLAVKVKLISFLEGKLMILLILLSAMFIFKDYVKKYIPKLFENNIGNKIYNINDQRWTLIPTCLTVIFSFVVNGKSEIEFLNTTHGLGFYCLWLGIIALVLYAFIYKNEKIKVIETINTDTRQTNNQTINIASEVNTTTPVEQNTAKTCMNCGTKTDHKAVKCPACGKEF